MPLGFLVTLRPLSLFFGVKLKKLTGKKVPKFALLGSCFSDLLAEAEIWYLKNFKCPLGCVFD